MKKFVFITLAALAATMFFSCNKNAGVVEEPTQNAPRYLKCVIATPAADPDSKVNVAVDGKTTWEVGDEILVHGAGSSNRKVVTLTASDISADGKTAKIDVSGVDPYDRTDYDYGSQYYAAYPASLVPAGNLYYNTVFSGDLNTFLLGGSDDENHDTIYFYNVCGLMTFSVAGDFDSFMLVGKNGETVGYTTIASRFARYLESKRSKYGGKADDVRYIKSGDGFTCAPVTVLNGSVTADGSTVNHIYFPAGASFSAGFTLYFKKAGEVVKYVESSKALTIAPGKLFPMGLIPAEKVHDYVAPTSHDASHPALAGATELDATAHANCYVIDGSDASNAGKAFYFKAYKGNGTIGVGSIASVQLLWETYNNGDEVDAKSVIAEVDFDKQDANDYYDITFKMPATLHAGNALIAAKNADGDILWSWHIWVPETAYTVDKFGVSSVDMMSRNLGALVDAEASTSASVDVRSYGLYYQWGRKDPFVGPKRVDSSSHALVDGTDWSKSASQMTIAEAIAAPTTFVSYKGDWNSTSDAELWGKSGSKTIYDPCPPGYRVPAYAYDDPMWKQVVSLDGFEVSDTYHWWKLGTAVFTLSGCIDYNGSFSHQNDRSWIWNRKANGNADYGEAQYVYYDTEHEPNAWASQPGWGKRKACACVIRCVVE